MFSKIMSGEDLERNKENFDIIDVRTKEEYEKGHVEGAINIPYDEILEHLDMINKDKPTVLYCRSNSRAEIASLSLKSVGFVYIYIADGVNLYDYKLVK